MDKSSFGNAENGIRSNESALQDAGLSGRTGGTSS